MATMKPVDMETTFRAMKATGVTAADVVRFDLRRLMRANRVTIAALADYMDVTQTRVRAIRNGLPVDYLVRIDYIEAVRDLAERKATEPVALASAA